MAGSKNYKARNDKGNKRPSYQQDKRSSEKVVFKDKKTLDMNFPLAKSVGASGANMLLNPLSTSVGTRILNVRLALTQLHQVDAVAGEVLDLIARYDTATGISTGVSLADVENFMTYNINAYVSMLQLQRAQNRKQLLDHNGVNISNAYNYLSASGLSVTDVDARYPATGSQTSIGTVAITNHTWATTYVAPTSKIKLSQGVFAYLNKHFSGVFRISSVIGIDRQVQFYSDSVVGNAALTLPETALLANITSLDALVLAHPALNDIMADLGWSHAPLDNVEFRRDPFENTLVVIEDPDMEFSLLNGQMGAYPDLSYAEYATAGLDDYIIIPAGKTADNYDFRLQIPSEVISKAILYRDNLYALQVNSLECDGTIEYDPALFMESAIISAEIPVPTTAAVNQWYSNWMNIQKVTKDFKDLFGASIEAYIADHTAASSAAIVCTIDIIATEYGAGFQTFYVSDLSDLLEFVYVPIMYGEDYRLPVTNKIRSKVQHKVPSAFN